MKQKESKIYDAFGQELKEGDWLMNTQGGRYTYTYFAQIIKIDPKSVQLRQWSGRTSKWVVSRIYSLERTAKAPEGWTAPNDQENA